MQLHAVFLPTQLKHHVTLACTVCCCCMHARFRTHVCDVKHAVVRLRRTAHGKSRLRRWCNAASASSVATEASGWSC
jgi:hypothetical protein